MREEQNSLTYDKDLVRLLGHPTQGELEVTP